MSEEKVKNEAVDFENREDSRVNLTGLLGEIAVSDSRRQEILDRLHRDYQSRLDDENAVLDLPEDVRMPACRLAISCCSDETVFELIHAARKTHVLFKMAGIRYCDDLFCDGSVIQEAIVSHSKRLSAGPLRKRISEFAPQ